MDWNEILLAALVGALTMVPVVFALRRLPKPPPEPPDPLIDSPVVTATLTALGSELAPGGSARWLAEVLGSERAAAVALVGSLQPGLPAEGPFEVNRLVAHAPVCLSGTVTAGAPTITSVRRLDVPSHG